MMMMMRDFEISRDPRCATRSMRRGVSSVDARFGRTRVFVVLPSRASSVLTRRVFLVCLFLSLSQLKREKTGLFDANTHFLEKNRDAAHAPNVPKMPGKCAKSKRLLDALEHGVFDALKKGYLLIGGVSYIASRRSLYAIEGVFVYRRVRRSKESEVVSDGERRTKGDG